MIHRRADLGEQIVKGARGLDWGGGGGVEEGDLSGSGEEGDKRGRGRTGGAEGRRRLSRRDSRSDSVMRARGGEGGDKR